MLPTNKKINTRIMRIPNAEIELERIPANPLLQAWDAADQYLLRHLEETRALNQGDKILILNDQFAALSVALANYEPVLLSDSNLTELALQRNLALNQYSPDKATFHDSLSMPEQGFDLILIKITKSLAMLEHQLYSLQALIGANTTIIGTGMTRHIHRSTLDLFGKILGPTRTTLAWKKSRLIQVEIDRKIKQGRSPYPDEFVLDIGRELTISNHANLFSRDRLDAGTRLLIEHIPVSDKYQTIVDLGCGNGILGLVAALFNPDAALLFVDESYMAVDSARQNFANAFNQDREAEYRVSNCLQSVESETADLVLNNPPFHQQNSTGDTVAWKMFNDARRVLKAGGELRVVGNRHLAYHAKLKKIFGNCEQVASNGRYVILNAVKKMPTNG